jgi:Ca2+/H+ antiporter, TMEM165/GDT1 family
LGAVVIIPARVYATDRGKMDINWTHAAPTVLAAFFASLVEFIEALTIVLAVGAVRGWRGAIGGAALALVVLLLLVVVLGPAITQIPEAYVQLVLGTLLLLFGMRWLRKAVLRAAGVLPLHDEDQAYAEESASLRAKGGLTRGWDRVAVSTAFKITMIEGVEVVFIVVAVGASGHGLLLPACLGALAALLLVVALGVVLHRPVAMIPENTLKFLVGILLCSFGTFWVGEGMAMSWPGGDVSLAALNVGYLAAGLVLVRLCRARAVSANVAGETL